VKQKSIRRSIDTKWLNYLSEIISREYSVLQTAEIKGNPLHLLLYITIIVIGCYLPNWINTPIADTNNNNPCDTVIYNGDKIELNGDCWIIIGDNQKVRIGSNGKLELDKMDKK